MPNTTEIRRLLHDSCMSPNLAAALIAELCDALDALGGDRD